MSWLARVSGVRGEVPQHRGEHKQHRVANGGRRAGARRWRARVTLRVGGVVARVARRHGGGDVDDGASGEVVTWSGTCARPWSAAREWARCAWHGAALVRRVRRRHGGCGGDGLARRGVSVQVCGAGCCGTCACR